MMSLTRQLTLARPHLLDRPGAGRCGDLRHDAPAARLGERPRPGGVRRRMEPPGGGRRRRPTRATARPSSRRSSAASWQSCGLASASGGRGCQPMDAKSVAALSGADFNALFNPLAEPRRHPAVRPGLRRRSTRATRRLLEQAVRRSARRVVVLRRLALLARGRVKLQPQLSQRRGDAVLSHLRSKFNDPDLDKEVGLLWLGEEFAQLDKDFCTWKRSGDPASCTGSELNRSAFVAWIDCRL
jgi:hypothetical protein